MYCNYPPDFEKKQHEVIERGIEIEKQQRRRQKPERIILLGSRDSGKTTVMKQLHILKNDGAELAEFKPLIHQQIIKAMKALISIAKKLHITMESAQHADAAEKILANANDGSFRTEHAAAIKSLWNDLGIRQAYEHNKREHLDLEVGETANYFFENVDRFADAELIPTITDVLFLKTASPSLKEVEMTFSDYKFTLMDLGVQCSDPRKWLPHLQDITAVVYCLSLAEYTQEDLENPGKTSIDRCGEILKHRALENAVFIIFFTKLFKKYPFKDAFSDYAPPTNTGHIIPPPGWTPAIHHIIGKLQVYNTSHRRIYTHNVCTIDTQNVYHVWKAVRASVTPEYYPNPVIE